MDALFLEHLPKTVSVLIAAAIWTNTSQSALAALLLLCVAAWREYEIKTTPRGLFGTYLMPPRDAPATRRTFEFSYKDEKIEMAMGWDGASRMHIDGLHSVEPNIVTRENDKVVMLATTPIHTYSITVTRFRNAAGATDHRWSIVKKCTKNGVEQFRIEEVSCWFTENAPDTDHKRSPFCYSPPEAAPSPDAQKPPVPEKPKPEVTIEKAGTSSGPAKIRISVSDVDWDALKSGGHVPFLLQRPQ